MRNDTPPCRKIWVALYKFIDPKQPEVKLSLFTSAVLEILLILIKFYENFSLYISDICNLLQCIIGVLVTLISVAVAGVAIIISLFSNEQIKIIEDIQAGTFETILNDFKWLALISGLDTAALIGVQFIVKSPFSIAPKYLLYIVSFLS